MAFERKIFRSHLKPSWLGSFQNIQCLPNVLLYKELLLAIIRMDFLKGYTGEGWEEAALVAEDIPS